jgi:endonuclease/exonuclease/phosphatase family metal-dependent hydrolase
VEKFNTRIFSPAMCNPVPLKYLLFLFVVACSLSCSKLQFLEKSDNPLFYSSKDSLAVIDQNDSLTVLTFNIKKARKIQLAITELKQFEKTKKIDVYLLQEMDEKGVEAIARELNLNYLYIPISYDKSDKKNIGNAILTKGTIAHPEKLILPHAKWMNKQRRSATIGEVTIRQKKILVYSIHTETFAMGRKERMDQIDGIIKHAKLQTPNYQYTLIGGDFNTVFSKDAQLVVEKFTGNGFNWSTDKVGSTARAMFGFVKPTNDYLFSRGLQLTKAFKIETSRSSDHYPVFATYVIKS